MSRWLVLPRPFDKKAVALQRTGQLGTYAACLGQEAIGVGLGLAMKREDVFIPAYREYACQFIRGVKMRDILLYWGGDERGMRFEGSGSPHDFPLSVPIATHVPHAIGVAYALKLKKEKRVVVASCGDGATSPGGGSAGPRTLATRRSSWSPGSSANSRTSTSSVAPSICRSLMASTCRKCL